MWRILCIAGLVFGLVVGCGQKGPLVLPDEEPQREKREKK